MSVISLVGGVAAEATSGVDPNFITFVASLDAPSAAPVTMGYRLLSGTGQARADAYFPNSTRSVTIAPGETQAEIAIRVDGDRTDERDEAVVLELFNPEGADFATGEPVLRATGFILDDDGAGANLALFASRPVVVEGDGGTKTVTFDVELSRPAPSTLSIPFETLEGSAQAGSDFTAASGTITIPVGGRAATVTLPVVGDTEVEPSELLILSLNPPSVVAEASLGAATILDDDAGTPTVSVEGASTREGTSGVDPFFLDFAVTLSAPATDAVTVGYRLLSGTGQAGADAYFPNSTRSVTFAPGETSKTVSVRVDADGADEPDETVVLEVFDATGAAIEGGASTARATGFILDDDGTGNKLALFVSRPVVVEGDSGTRQANFEVTLSRPAPSAFSTDFVTVEGSAREGEDYQRTQGTLVFVEGQTTAAVSVPVLSDTEVEPTDFFTLGFTTPAIVAETSIGSATILDDDAGMPTINVQGASTREGTSGVDPFFLGFAVTLDAPSLDAVTVGYRLLSGTAQAGADAYFPNSTRAVTFAPGETSKTVSVRVDADGTDEPDEAVVLEIFGAEGGVIAGGAPTARATGIIIDDDGVGEKIALFVSRPVVVEGDDGETAQANFEITLSRPAPSALSIPFSTVDGSATEGEDFQAVSGTLELVKGQTSASVSVPVTGDGAIEPSETFTLSFDAPAFVAETSLGSAVIIDDDAGTPTVTVTGASTREGTSGVDPFFVNFGITLSEAATDAVTVNYRLLSGTGQATSDAYFPNSTRSVTFLPGETSKTVGVRVDGDGIDETDEAVVLEIFDPTGATIEGGATRARATGFILDDDGVGNDLALFVSNPVVLEGPEGGGGQANFEVELSRPAPSTFTTTFATVDGSAIAGEDYVATSGTLTFVEGQTSAGVSVDLIGDVVVEASELFTLDFETPNLVASTSLGAATVLDDDAGTAAGLPTVSVAGDTTAEGTSGVDPFRLSFAVTLSEAPTDAVTVEYRLLTGSGEARSDAYFPSSARSVTFLPGETSKTVSVRVDGDGADERDEAVALEIFNADGAVIEGGQPAARATGFVLDDDGAGNNLALFVASPVVVEDGPSRQVTFDLALSRPAPSDFDLPYILRDATAQRGSDFASAPGGTIAFVEGQSRAAVAIDLVGGSAVEAAEVFSLAVEPPNLITETRSEPGIVLDDDPFLPGGAPGGDGPVISIMGDAVREQTSGVDPAFLEYRVFLSEPSDDAVTVSFALEDGTATAGTDAYFSNSARAVTFLPGETSKSVFVRLDGDGEDEVDETIFLTLSDPVGAQLAGGVPELRAMGFILDDDGAGNNAIAAASRPSALEEVPDGAEANFEIRLSRPAEGDVTIGYATAAGSGAAGAAPGADFAQTSGAVTFAEGMTTAGVDVAIAADAASEPDETFGLVLNGGGLTALVDGVATIFDSGPLPDTPPMAVGDTASAVEDEPPVTIDVLVNDTDGDNDAITLAGVTQPTRGTASISAGQVVFDPGTAFQSLADGETTTETFGYTITAGGQTAGASVTVTVTGVNDAPAATDDAAATSAGTTVGVPVLTNDADPDAGDALSILAGSVALLTAGAGTAVASETQIAFTPADGFSGVAEIGYAVTDGTVSDDAILRVAVEPGAPSVVAVDDAFTVGEDGPPVTFAPLANDGPDDGSLSLASIGLVDRGTAQIVGDAVSFDPGGAFEALGAGETATVSFAYTATDDTDSDTATITVTVEGANDAPTAADDGATVPEDGSVLIPVLANDADPEGDTLSIASVGAAGNGAVTVEGGQLRYTPGADFSGTDSFGYTVTDGADTASATVTVDVGAVADATVAADDAYTVSEDGTLAIGAAAGVLANDSDPDGGPLTATLIAGPSNGTLTLNPDGSFDYAPDGDFDGQDTFAYAASDGFGDADGATVTITVTPEPDVPVAVADDASTGFETPLTVAAVAGVLANDIDADGDPLTAVLETDVSNGTLALRADGGYDYQPDAGFSGSDGFIYRASDGTSQSGPVSVTIAVAAPGNRPPTAAEDGFTTGEDAGVAVLGNVLANDGDPDGDPLALAGLTASDGTAIAPGSATALPEGGMLAVASDGTVTFDPAGAFEPLGPGDTATVRVAYVVADEAGLTDGGTLTITVEGANDAPDAGDDRFAVAGGETLEVSAFLGLLANDADIDGGTLSVDPAPASGPSNGTVTLVPDGAFSYTPDGDFAGTDEFVYRVSDGIGGTDTAVVRIDVDGAGLTEIVGTPGNDRLAGTDGDDLIRSLGGRLDVLRGEGGDDTFDFADIVGNGLRETRIVADFAVDETVRLGDASIVDARAAGADLLLTLDGDGDVIRLAGVVDLGDVVLA